MAALKYLIALIVIVAAWLVWWLAKFPLWVPITLTVITVLALLGWLIYGRFRARQAAHQLENALGNQASQQADNARPDVQAELEEIRSEFDKAVGALKSSKLGRGRRDALYMLPWYVIIGPPGAGKTTALRNCGLQFPYLSAQGSRGVRGIGGTRNCDWWLTNEAVLLDTAGRWSTEAEDREEWLGFLGLLKKYRKKKPLNGLIVTLSVVELVEASSEQLVELAKAVRERIDEAMAQLQMVLPVYVLFTKCDLISGFVESFGNLSKEERSVVWGFTVPLDEKADPGEQFETHFDELINSLEAFSVRRLKEERRVDVRHKIFGFPQQLQELKPSFAEFLKQLFEDNVFSDRPLMRGAYFASGTQEGRPFDRIMARLASAYSLEVSLEQEHQVEQKGYFLRDLFRKVIFVDKDLALRSEGERKRQKRFYYATVGSIFVLAGLLLTLPSYSYFSNRAWIGKFKETGEALVALVQKDKGGMLTPSAYQPMLEALDELDQQREEGPPVRMRSGLYQGEALKGPVNGFFGRVLEENVIRPLFTEDSSTLDTFGRNYEALAQATPSRTEYVDGFDRLERHLLLSSPKEELEPALEDVVADKLADGIGDRWERKLGSGVRDEGVNSLAVSVSRAYVSALVADDKLGFKRDESVVRRSRRALSRVSALDLAIDGLVAQHERRFPEITVRTLVGGGVPAMVGKRSVPAAFTKPVWEKHLKKLFTGDGSGLSGGLWVLGEYGPQGKGDGDNDDRYRQQLLSRYLERYIDEWREFIRAIRIESAGPETDAIQLLQDLTRGKPTPLARMFAQIGYHVDLVEPPPELGAVEGAVGAAALEAATRAATRRAGRAGRVAGEIGGAAGSGEGGSGARVKRYLTEEDVRDAFKGWVGFGVPEAPTQEGAEPQPTGLDVYLEQLLFLRNTLAAHSNNSSSKELSRELRSAESRTTGLIGQQEIGWRPSFDAILLPPIDAALLDYDRGNARAAGRAWCSGVSAPFEQNFGENYPFNARGQEAPLPSFAAFYKPNTGVLWTFYEEMLRSSIPRRGQDFAFANELEGSDRRVYTNGLVQFLNRSWMISSSLFSGSEPRFDFRVRLRPSPRVAVQILSVGGESYEYYNQPEQWTRMTWPGKSPDEGASIEIRGDGGMREVITQDGAWGLFRLLEQGSAKRQRNSQVFSVKWRLQSHDVDVTLDIKPVKNASPFFSGGGRRPSLMGMFRGASAAAPSDIVSGQSICR